MRRGSCARRVVDGPVLDVDEADSPEPVKMNPVGSALVSRIEANRTQPSVTTSSSSPSGRQIQRSLPRSLSPAVEALDGGRTVFEHDEIARVRLKGDVVEHARSSGCRRRTDRRWEWSPVGRERARRFSTRHMISPLTPLFSTTLLSLWLIRPVLAQHALNTPFSTAIGSMSMSSGR